MSKKPRFTSHSIHLSVSPERGLKKRDVNIHLVTPGAEEFADQPIEAAYGLGLGNGRGAAQRALGHVMMGKSPHNVALMGAFPYWRMSSAAGLTELAIEGWSAAFDFLSQRNASLPKQQGAGGELARPIHAGAESQSVFSLVRTLDENPELFEGGKVGLVHPHAVLHRTKLGVVTGLGASLFQRDQLVDLRGYPVGGAAAAIVLDDIFCNGLRGMNFATDSANNVGEPLQRLVALRGADNVRVLGGERDRLYPAIPLQKRLGELGIGEIFQLMPGASHSSHATVAGGRQLEQAFDWMFASAQPETA